MVFRGEEGQESPMFNFVTPLSVPVPGPQQPAQPSFQPPVPERPIFHSMSMHGQNLNQMNFVTPPAPPKKRPKRKKTKSMPTYFSKSAVFAPPKVADEPLTYDKPKRTVFMSPPKPVSSRFAKPPTDQPIFVTPPQRKPTLPPIIIPPKPSFVPYNIDRMEYTTKFESRKMPTSENTNGIDRLGFAFSTLLPPLKNYPPTKAPSPNGFFGLISPPQKTSYKNNAPAPYTEYDDEVEPPTESGYSQTEYFDYSEEEEEIGNYDYTEESYDETPINSIDYENVDDFENIGNTLSIEVNEKENLERNDIDVVLPTIKINLQSTTFDQIIEPEHISSPPEAVFSSGYQAPVPENTFGDLAFPSGPGQTEPSLGKT